MELRLVETPEEDIDSLRFKAEATAAELSKIKLEKDYDNIEKIYAQMEIFLDLIEKIFGKKAEINDAERTFIMEISNSEGKGGHFSFFRMLLGEPYTIELHAFFDKDREEYGFYDREYYKRGEKDPDDEEDKKWAVAHRVIDIKRHYGRCTFTDDFMLDRLMFCQTTRAIGKMAKSMLRATDSG